MGPVRRRVQASVNGVDGVPTGVHGGGIINEGSGKKRGSLFHTIEPLQRPRASSHSRRTKSFGLKRNFALLGQYILVYF